MWFLLLKSGVHATVAGVMLAFAIPFSAKDDDAESPSHRLEHCTSRLPSLARRSGPVAERRVSLHRARETGP